MSGLEAAKRDEIQTMADLVASLDFINRSFGVGTVRYEMDGVKAFLRTTVVVPVLEMV